MRRGRSKLADTFTNSAGRREVTTKNRVLSCSGYSEARRARASAHSSCTVYTPGSVSGSVSAS